MNLEHYAQAELQAAGLFDKTSDYGGMLGEATMRLIRVFATEGHSGFSASLAIKLFEKLARFEPITPLTGNDDEWVGVSSGLFQNRRCSTVFKSPDGAYDIEGRIFREPDGSTFITGDSHTPVTFPYTPGRRYVDVPAR